MISSITNKGILLSAKALGFTKIYLDLIIINSEGAVLALFNNHEWRTLSKVLDHGQPVLDGLMQLAKAFGVDCKHILTCITRTDKMNAIGERVRHLGIAIHTETFVTDNENIEWIPMDTLEYCYELRFAKSYVDYIITFSQFDSITFDRLSTFHAYEETGIIPMPIPLDMVTEGDEHSVTELTDTYKDTSGSECVDMIETTPISTIIGELLHTTNFIKCSHEPGIDEITYSIVFLNKLHYTFAFIDGDIWATPSGEVKKSESLVDSILKTSSRFKIAIKDMVMNAIYHDTYDIKGLVTTKSRHFFVGLRPEDYTFTEEPSVHYAWFSYDKLATQELLAPVRVYLDHIGSSMILAQLSMPAVTRQESSGGDDMDLEIISYKK